MSRIAASFDERAALIKKTNEHFKGALVAEAKLSAPDQKAGLLSAEAIRTNLLLDMKDAVKQADVLRSGDQSTRCVDMDFNFFSTQKFGMDTQSLYNAIGVDPSAHTIFNLTNMTDLPDGFRWLVPEIIREAIRTGLRRNPMYPDLIAGEESVTQMQMTMPMVNMSDATPQILNETETIPVGMVSFAQKLVKLKKIGTGLKVSDEVQKFVPLNILSLYLQDAGVQLGLGLDTMLIDTLVNGEQADGSMAAPVIGVTNTTPGITYEDILRIWLHMGRLGRIPTGMMSNVTAALKMLQFKEFSGWEAQSTTPRTTVNFRTPIPKSQDYFVHGAMPSGDKMGIISRPSSVIKLNASGLLVESERIAERGLTGTYATVMTGFAKLFRDSFVILDGTQTIGSAPIPTWMDVSIAENILIQ